MLKFVRFTELPVTDQDRAVEFYTEKIGMTVGKDAPYQQGWRWIELRIEGADTAVLLTRRPEGDDPRGEPRLVLTVDDVEAAWRDMAGAGVDFIQKPTRAAWSPEESYALFRDSEGNTVMIGSG